MTTLATPRVQPSPSTPPQYRRPQLLNYPSPYASPSRIQISAASTLIRPLAFSPFRTSAVPHSSASLLSPSSSATVRSAARALTQLRSPNRFQAPLDDDDEGEAQYRESITADRSDDEDEERERKYDDDDDDERESGALDGLVDLSALLLQLRVDKRRTSPQRRQAASPARKFPVPHDLLSSSPPSFRQRHAFANNDTDTPSSSLPIVPSPLESSIALTLHDMQRQHVERAEEAIDIRLSALQTALQSALAPAATAATSPLLSPLSTLASLHSSTRSPIQSLSSEWKQHHAAQQGEYKRRLDAMLAAEERKRQAREEAESRLRQEAAEVEAETARRTKAAEEEKERNEREQKEQEENRQKEEQLRKQQEAEVKQQEEQKQQLQQPQQPAASSNSAASQLPSISPAQAELQPHQARLADVRAQAATYSSPDKTKHKVLINRTITQISHTKQSVQSKSLAINSLLQQARQGGNQAEYAWVVETIASKLVAQGETRVALQLSSAYSFGAVVLHVCRADATLWSCFYALLCERCVYCIPHYAERRQHPSQSAHMAAMGYQQQTDAKGEAVWEEEQQYFERQQGFVALYAAVCQYTTPHSATSHIHSLPQAWLWLSRLCNQTPRSATASVLFAFLSTAAFAMHRRFGQQMAKLLAYVSAELVSRMERDGGPKTPARKASLVRLQLWLSAETEVLRRTGQLTEPEGRQLPAGQSQSTDTLHVDDNDYRGE